MNMFKSAHLEAICPSCRKAHGKDWKPKFWREVHYLHSICECGYKINIRTPHFHSGHY
ncbi:hypothetical protein JW826_06375 [Candidatus Woesearchaeota archaeon]|nr:hypothetical protein [Candidatus Woesearchaeota archaeon]